MGLCIALPVQLFKITISDFFLLKEEITEGCITHCAIVGIYKDCSFIAICSSFEGLWGCSFKAIFHPPGRRDSSFIVLFHPLGRPDCSVIAICSSSIGLWDCSFIVIFVILYTVGLWDCSFIDIFVILSRLAVVSEKKRNKNLFLQRTISVDSLLLTFLMNWMDQVNLEDNFLWYEVKCTKLV